jgi:CheY-like chemotaxis protein
MPAKILVVDGDAQVREDLAAGLGQRFPLTLAATAKEALSALTAATRWRCCSASWTCRTRTARPCWPRPARSRPRACAWP